MSKEMENLSEDQLAQVSAGLQSSNKCYCRQCRWQVQLVQRESSPGKYIFIYECKHCGWEGQDPMRD